MENLNYSFQVRVTGILQNEQDQLLIVKQRLSDKRGWSLPGGRLERGESMEGAIIREMMEETGLEVSVECLLYLSDVMPMDKIIHVTFLLKYISGQIRPPDNSRDENPIGEVRFVDIGELSDFGFSEKFARLVKDRFPGRGSYMGDKANIGLGV